MINYLCLVSFMVIYLEGKKKKETVSWRDVELIMYVYILWKCSFAIYFLVDLILGLRCLQTNVR